VPESVQIRAICGVQEAHSAFLQQTLTGILPQKSKKFTIYKIGIKTLIFSLPLNQEW